MNSPSYCGEAFPSDSAEVAPAESLGLMSRCPMTLDCFVASFPAMTLYHTGRPPSMISAAPLASSSIPTARPSSRGRLARPTREASMIRPPA
jgi:hypothetical protein